MSLSRDESTATVVEEREIDSVAEKSKSLETLGNARVVADEKAENLSSLLTIFGESYSLWIRSNHSKFLFRFQFASDARST